VVWLDAMGVRSAAAAGRSWAPVGQTPVVKGTGKRFRVNLLGAISNAGMLRFRLFAGSFRGPLVIDFLGRLLRDCGGRKVHLIVAGHRVHRAKAVSAWVGRHAGRIELHVLPGDSPSCIRWSCWTMTSRPTRRVGVVPARRTSSVMSCTGICVVGRGSQRSWSASLTTRRLGMPPPHESHHLPAAVITSAPTVGGDLRERLLAQRFPAVC
jgi:DDE superfamily endonuclease